MTNQCVLEIGELRVAIHLTSQGFLRQIRQRYKDFLSEIEPSPDLTLDLSLFPPSLTTPLLLSPRFALDQIFFEEEGFTGSINPREKKAVLSLASPTPENDFDYFLRVVFALLVFQKGGLLFHAAGVVHKETACLFFGPSGSGKTTVARLSSPRKILNDDLLILRPEKEGWLAFGTPFWNPSQVRPAPEKAAVGAMFRLKQNHHTTLCPIPPGQALAEILAGVPVLSTNPTFSLGLFDICQKLAHDIPIMALDFQKDAIIWDKIEKFLDGNTTGT